MMDYNEFLSRVVYLTARHFEDQVGVCEVHPGMLSDAQLDAVKDNSPLIYTTLSEILETEKVDTGDVRNNIRMVSFILVYNLSPAERDKLVRELVYKMVNFLVGQRWGMATVFPAEEVKAFDLHGLLRNPDQIVGTQGWSPTLQARASDLFGVMVFDKDPQFSIWCVSWDQALVAIREEVEALDLMVLEKSFKVVDMGNGSGSYSGRFSFAPPEDPLPPVDDRQKCVKELSMSDWFSEYDEYGIRYIVGTLSVVPPDEDAQLLSEYHLYWGDPQQRRLPDMAKITGFNSTGAAVYTFPVKYKVPGSAAYFLAYGRSSRGYSHTPAVMQICDLWLNGTPATIAASAHAVAAVNRKLYKWGGNAANGNPMRTGEVYGDKSWNPLDAFSTSLNRVLAVGQVGKKILLLGETAKRFAVVKYDWESGAWAPDFHEYTLDKVPTAAAMLNYDFYILTVNKSGFTDNIFAYKTDAPDGSAIWLSGDNFGSDLVSPKKPIFRRKQFGICAGSGRIFLLGGMDESVNYLKTFTAYHPGQRKWSEMTEMPFAVRNCACIVSGHKLYVLGGEADTGEVVARVLTYDFFEQTWQTAPSMTTPRKLAAVTLLNGNLYITGGIDNAGNLLSSMEIYIHNE